MDRAKYKVAIIGTGRMGGLIEDELKANAYSMPYGHFSSYRAIEETEVVAVANRGQERLKRFAERFDVSNTYLDYREMIEKEKPDIVSVTTPSFARAEPIIFAAEHGAQAVRAPVEVRAPGDLGPGGARANAEAVVLSALGHDVGLVFARHVSGNPDGITTGP